MTTSYRLGIDIGGTFSDFAVVDDADGTIRVEKTLTSAHAPEESVMRGIGNLAGAVPDLLARTGEVIHATTLVTNVILERKGAKTGLIATEGFRDILELAREVRYDIYDMFIRLPEPMVPRRRRIGVPERVLADGSVLVPLDETTVRRAAAVFRDEDVAAVAVSFLHSYRNGAHERRAAEILREELPGVTVSLSHEVHPEPKEYERTSTTVIDAYVKAVAEGYLERLAEGLAKRGYRERLFIMLSNGGTATVETAKRVPVQIVESGPAAGVEAAAYFGRLLGLDNLLSFDMGGTTAKLCIIENGRAARTRTYEVDRVHRFKAGSGLPAAVPVYDLLEIGAGGGSIARVDDLGLIQVGPDSAGSAPGPACYDLGGTAPTVTDADLVLGYLNPDYFLGGRMRLDRGAAERAVAGHLAVETGLTTLEAAAGVHEIVNENMASAAQVYVAEKGKAPPELSMVAFGGAGPVHAAGLARKLGCPRLVIPPHSGVMSSLGLLAAPVAFERSRAVRRILKAVDLESVESGFREIESEAGELMPDGVAPIVRRSVDLRYSGQDYPLEIEAAGPCDAPSTKLDWETRFEAAYHGLYGKVDDDNPVELASIRVHVSQPPPALEIARPAAESDAPPKASREIHVSAGSGMERVAVYERTALRIGQEIVGPAVIEERESTTVIGPGDRLKVDPLGCLVVDLVIQRPTAAAGGADETPVSATFGRK
ncbi:MAG: hydantoinase/oxoprolinase family protein [Immundisolibacterales bacterium]|nr:hydantoinase/oxoprolinase family protein [Immundisolibacterales bacterium]